MTSSDVAQDSSIVLCYLVKPDFTVADWRQLFFTLSTTWPATLGKRSRCAEVLMSCNWRKSTCWSSRHEKPIREASHWTSKWSSQGAHEEKRWLLLMLMAAICLAMSDWSPSWSSVSLLPAGPPILFLTLLSHCPSDASHHTHPATWNTFTIRHTNIGAIVLVFWLKSGSMWAKTARRAGRLLVVSCLAPLLFSGNLLSIWD